MTVVGFWKVNGPHGEFCQWYISEFIFDDTTRANLPAEITSLSLFKDRPDVINNLTNHTYNCAEQFMMAGKAYLFDDTEVATMIHNQTNPSRHKNLGRKVNNFDQTVWTKYCTDIVTIGSYLKFTQDTILRKKLMNTGNAVLAEGSPYDKIWGIGLRYDDTNIQYKNKWRGQNKLGNCLMFIRDLLQSD